MKIKTKLWIYGILFVFFILYFFDTLIDSSYLFTWEYLSWSPGARVQTFLIIFLPLWMAYLFIKNYRKT